MLNNKNENTSSEKYFKDVDKNKLLTRQQELEYFSQMSEGDGRAKERAMEKLVLHNLRLVASVAKGYQNRGCDIEDLLQEGNIGLMNGIEKFDVSKGVKLSTYATYWIRQRIDRYVQNNGKTVRLPVHVLSISSKMNKLIKEYRREHNTEPSVEYLCQKLDCTPEIGKSALQSITTPNPIVQIDHSAGDEGDDSMHSYIVDNKSSNPLESLSHEDIIKVVKQSLSKLSPREEKIIRLRFGIQESDTDHENFPITQEEFQILKDREQSNENNE